MFFSRKRLETNDAPLQSVAKQLHVHCLFAKLLQADVFRDDLTFRL